MTGSHEQRTGWLRVIDKDASWDFVSAAGEGDRGDQPTPGLRADVPHLARIYDWL